jgi:hypothetical protein
MLALGTDLTVELRARRAELIRKSLQRELQLGDLVNHETFIEERAAKLLILREDLSRRHRLAHARMAMAKRGADVHKIAAAIAQGEKAEREADTLNADVQQLQAEAAWLHASEGWKQVVEHLKAMTVKTATGEVLSAAQLAEDEALYGDGGELSFENLLMSMKEEAKAEAEGKAEGREGEGGAGSSGGASTSGSSRGSAEAGPAYKRSQPTSARAKGRAQEASSHKVDLFSGHGIPQAAARIIEAAESRERQAKEEAAKKALAASSPSAS